MSQYGYDGNLPKQGGHGGYPTPTPPSGYASQTSYTQAVYPPQGQGYGGSGNVQPSGPPSSYDSYPQGSTVETEAYTSTRGLPEMSHGSLSEAMKLGSSAYDMYQKRQNKQGKPKNQSSLQEAMALGSSAFDMYQRHQKGKEDPEHAQSATHDQQEQKPKKQANIASLGSDAFAMYQKHHKAGKEDPAQAATYDQQQQKPKKDSSFSELMALGSDAMDMYQRHHKAKGDSEQAARHDQQQGTSGSGSGDWLHSVLKSAPSGSDVVVEKIFQAVRK